MICFCNYKLEKSGLPKCIKSPMSEHLWGVNMLSGPKHCLNLHGCIFVIFFDEFEEKISVSVVSESLRLFANILTTDDKYSLSVKASV